ncbi:MAG: response regulator transcription factor [bacterium]
MKILIVDDSKRLRKLIISLLRDNGTEFYEAEDGCFALTEYIRIKPDVVLMDIMMEIENGLEAAGQILRRYPSAKIILVTNYDDNAYRDAANALGITGYILKENLTYLPGVIKNIYSGNLNTQNLSVQTGGNPQ